MTHLSVKSYIYIFKSGLVVLNLEMDLTFQFMIHSVPFQGKLSIILLVMSRNFQFYIQDYTVILMPLPHSL